MEKNKASPRSLKSTGEQLKRSEQSKNPDRSKNTVKKTGTILDRIAYGIVKKFILRKKSRPDRLQKEILLLEGGKKEAVLSFYVRETKEIMVMTALLLLLFLLVFFTEQFRNNSIEDLSLKRPRTGEAGIEETLVVSSSKGYEEEIPVTVSGRTYTDEEAEALLLSAEESVEEQALGENTTFDEVRSDLNFPSQLENGAVSVTWTTIPYGMISDTGAIVGEPDEEGTLIEIHAQMSCQSRQKIREWTVCVYPPILEGKDAFVRSVRKELEKADQSTISEETMILPQEAGNQQLEWQYPKQNYSFFILILLIILPFGLYVHRDQQIHDQVKERAFQLQMDYSELMWKMTMLLGAGLTIRSTFTKIAVEYRKKNGVRRYLYEEMLYTCYEMKNGIPEAEAYERFGKRCGLPVYIKFGSQLSQNLKKGSLGLRELTLREAAASMEERKRLARKLGEQAGTKLLFPMVMMLVIVMAILVLPAFMTF